MSIEKRPRWSRAEKWLCFLVPLLLIVPFGVQRWQRMHALQKPALVWQHTGTANSVAFSPDGLHAVTAGGELKKGPQVRVWNLQCSQYQAQYVGHGGQVMSLEALFSPSGNRVLGVKGDGFVEQWKWPVGDWINALGEKERAENGPGFGAMPLQMPREIRLFRAGWSVGRVMSVDYAPTEKRSRLAVT